MNGIKQLLSIMLPVRKAMALAASLNILTIGSNIALLATSAYLIAAAALHPPLAALALSITGVRSFGLSRAVFRYAERYTSHWATFQILYQMRVWFYTKLEPLAPANLMQYRSGDILGRIVSDVDTLQFFYLRVIAPPFVALFILSCMAYWLSFFSLGLAVILVMAFGLAGMLIPFLIHRQARNIAKERLAARAFVKAQVVDALGGLTELSAFNQIGRQIDKLTGANVRLANLNRKVDNLNAVSETLSSLVVNFSVWSILIIAIPLASNGLFDKVWLAAIVIAAQASFEAVYSLPLAGYFLDASLSAGRRLSAITEAVPVVAEAGSMSISPENFSLIVSKMGFSYEGTSKNALTDISFELRAGQHLAIVGPSGAGKSSILNILSRFFEYSEGKITFGGHDLRDYHPDNLRRYFAVVSQSSYIFNSSVKDNILMAKPLATQSEFMAAIENAGLKNFINSLPGGEAALISHSGKFLSGGEKQRVAIARALLKDAPILILDEPTAGLDAITAQKVMSEIHNLMEGRSSILITHDLSGLEAMDEIIVLEEGRIIERGRFQELLCQNGLFAEMYCLHKDVLSYM